MKSRNNLRVNNLFFRGFYKLNKTKKPAAAFIAHKLGDNPLNISFKKNSFTFKLSKNISEFVLHRNLSDLICLEIEKLLEDRLAVIKDISTTLINFQATCTLFNCEKQVLLQKILPHFCELFPPQQFGIAQESNSTIDTFITPERITELKCFAYILITLKVKTQNITVKFQLNNREKKIHISIITPIFNEFVKKLYSFFDVYGNRYKPKISDLFGK